MRGTELVLFEKGLAKALSGSPRKLGVGGFWISVGACIARSRLFLVQMTDGRYHYLISVLICTTASVKFPLFGVSRINLFVAGLQPRHKSF